MAKVMDAWVVAWAIVSLTLATQLTKIQQSLLNVCVSMGTSLTYQSVTYELSVATQIFCAALCLDKGAQRYIINGESDVVAASSFFTIPYHALFIIWANGNQQVVTWAMVSLKAVTLTSEGRSVAF